MKLLGYIVVGLIAFVVLLWLYLFIQANFAPKPEYYYVETPNVELKTIPELPNAPKEYNGKG